MWLLLACADGAPDGKDAVRDDIDTAAADGDTADTGDTGNANERCQGDPTVLDVPVGGQLSPYATLLTTDLDGGGVPDVLHERWDGRRGVALLRGEDLLFGGTTDAAAWVPTLLETAQASLVLGTAGDLDGDGLPEVVVAEGTQEYDETALSVWSLARPDAPLATLVSATDGTVEVIRPAPTPADDLDGDGVPELVAVNAAPGAPDESVFVFSGAAVMMGQLDVAAAHLVVSGSTGVSFEPLADTDLDGDGIGDIVFGQLGAGTEDLVLLPGGLAARGGVVDAADLDVLLPTAGTRLPHFADIDADGLPELYAADHGGESYLVRGFTGDQVSGAARSGTTLDPEDAWVTLAGAGRDYLGMHIVPVTDAWCAPGIAISAHFSDWAYIASNDTLVAGGTLDTGVLAALDGRDWFGYALAGGQDLDQDGALDLAIGNREGVLSLYLNPAALAEPP